MTTSARQFFITLTGIQNTTPIPLYNILPGTSLVEGLIVYYTH